MSKRSFFRRDKKVEVEAISGIAAVKLERGGAGRSLTANEAFGSPADSATLRKHQIDMGSEEAAAFARADWMFVKPNRRMKSISRTSSPPSGAEEIGNVIRHESGRIAIVTHDLIVKFAPEIQQGQIEKIIADNNCVIVRRFGFSQNMFEVRSVDDQDGIDKANTLEALQEVMIAEPSLVEHVPGRSQPGDPVFDDQWQWNNTGQSGGVVGADISAVGAWNITAGQGVRVAVIDNGFNASHMDLFAGVSSQSGFFDSSFETPFVNDQGRIPLADHGTFCAGQVGARWNNGTAGCGAAPECELMLIATLPDQIGTQSTLARGIAYAADPALEHQSGDGAHILSCSLGPNGADWEMSTVVDEALKYAAQKGRNGRGLPIFWATTNGNFEIRHDEVVSHEDVIAVGRSTRHDLENNSGYGPELDFLAPGVDVVNIYNSGYGPGTGTSYAAPIAAGVAALMLAVNPSLTAKEVRQILQESCTQIGPLPYVDGRNDDYGYGRVNAAQAVRGAMATVPVAAARHRIPAYA